MKTPSKTTSTKADKSAKPKVKTQAPLAEKDEVKQAEDNQREKVKSSK